MDKVELTKILEKFGFTWEDGIHRYKHKLIPNVEFDFSACSLEGIMFTIYEMGRLNGIRDTQKSMRFVLGIAEEDGHGFPIHT